MFVAVDAHAVWALILFESTISTVIDQVHGLVAHAFLPGVPLHLEPGVASPTSEEDRMTARSRDFVLLHLGLVRGVAFFLEGKWLQQL
jgi:hypothetical protein